MSWDSLTNLLNGSVTKQFEVTATIRGGVYDYEEVRGVFTDYHQEINMGEPGVSANDPIFECSDSEEFKVALVYEARILIKDQEYKIVDIQPDKQGWTEYILEEIR